MKTYAPGDKRTYDGVEYVAIAETSACCAHKTWCAFDNGKGDICTTRWNARPGQNCSKLIWLTPHDALVHRLTH